MLKKQARRKTPPETDGTPIRVRLGETPLSHRMGGALRVLAGPKALGAKNLIFGCVLLAPGEKLSAHRHLFGEEILHVLEGSGRFRIGDRTLCCGPGDTMIARPGQLHSAVNDGETPLRLMFASAPQAPAPEKGHTEEEEP